MSSFFPVLGQLSILFVLALATACNGNGAGDGDATGKDGQGAGGGSAIGGSTGNTGGWVPIGFGGFSAGGRKTTSPAVCGNSQFEEGEVCDDGNAVGGDGCSADCSEVDSNFICLEAGEPCVRVVTCGNGVLEGGEVCDDNNAVSGDGCQAGCDAIETGFACVKPGELCVPLPVCGNGVRERGEQCDDGQSPPAAGDGCNVQCQLEPGYFCPPGQPCVPRECGDGVRTPDEQCDDNNQAGGDGCSSECKLEAGFRCSATGCSPICGNGRRDGAELASDRCDDGNLVSGDGCSAACRVEPFFSCSGEPSNCATTIACGNGTVDPGEVCDWAITGQEACYAELLHPGFGCKGFDRDMIDAPVCGNGTIELDEECDGDQGNGGCVNCEITSGFACPKANYCVRLPSCGDGTLSPGEQCDAGAMSAIGCSNCQVQPSYFCSGEPSVCVASVCGDGTRAPNEQCDDHNLSADDGCSPTCTVETGWVCPPGIGCQPVCGDGVLKGTEQCDTPDANACVNCRLKPGFTCGAGGTANPCTATVCGNNTKEPSEGCDDGNKTAGDGCGPTCQLEPSVTRMAPDFVPVVQVTCGDGLKTGSEGCDDGNTTSGDGCSSTCTVENGWTCTDQVTRPSFVDFRVTYRDFKARSEANGHPDFQWVPSPSRRNMPGPVCTATASARCTEAKDVVCAAGTCGWLDGDGKPVFHLTGTQSEKGTVTSADTYALWYRNYNPITMGGSTISGQNGAIDMWNTNGVLRLTQQGGANSDTYSFSSSSYFPLTGNGFGNYADTNLNYHFTSELRYFFRYQGGETLTFSGDDDVWVFVNGRHAVDIGGVHGVQWGRVVLGDDGIPSGTDSDCSVHGGGSSPSNCTLSNAEQTDASDTRFGLTKGGVYEIVLFHAERHTSGSNFNLTLAGFLSPRSSCSTNCGDGIRAGTEICDGGPNMPVSGYGVCLKNQCKYQYCGDNAVNGSETCDNGLNVDIYGTSGCAPGCVAPASCGDGTVQSAFEVCDDGVNNGSYGGCMPGCQALAPYCGDGQQQANEDCDTPGQFVIYAESGGACGFDCKFAAYCGDGVRNGPELCDGAAPCNSNCEFDPYCGDGIKTQDEQCDYGAFAFDGLPANAPYAGCTNQCLLGPYCGDGALQGSAGEECDNGTANASDGYGGCTNACTLGPRCGDGVHQQSFGEACDNGFNDDDYAYLGSVEPCGPACTAVPYCGDGAVQSAYELCDAGAANSDGSYDGCTTRCEWGPYCGDGMTNGGEQCDLGAGNVAYSAAGFGCSLQCTTNVPYCGDGVRNGPEQCDLGTGGNTGAHGGCKADCTRAPFCGDRSLQADAGEECDDGPTGSARCTQVCKLRLIIK